MMNDERGSVPHEQGVVGLSMVELKAPADRRANGSGARHGHLKPEALLTRRLRRLDLLAAATGRRSQRLSIA